MYTWRIIKRSVERGTAEFPSYRMNYQGPGVSDICIILLAKVSKRYVASYQRKHASSHLHKLSFLKISKIHNATLKAPPAKLALTFHQKLPPKLAQMEYKSEKQKQE